MIQGRVVFTAAVLFVALPVVSAAQETAVPTVRLVSPHTQAGGETFVNIMLDAVADQPVQVVKSEVDYQTGELTYVVARLGFAAETARAKLDVREVRPPDAQLPPGKSRLVITVTGDRPLPTGPLVEIRFNASAELPSGIVKVDHRAEGSSPTGTPVASLAAKPGEMHITSIKPEEPPKVFACFFYMH
jgi:hypothetical protein